MKRIKRVFVLALCTVLALLCFYGCARGNLQKNEKTAESASTEQNNTPTSENSGQSQESGKLQTGIIANQILHGETGEIHYSYYLPDGYDESRSYPLMMAMPGYDMMWFGDDSAGSNLTWRGFLSWTELSQDMIVVSAQFTDWHETSARQAIELTQYFIDNFAVDKNRVYACGYSAGGETMSQAVSMRPDLYAAYLHGSSQWDGEYKPVAKTAWRYIFLWLKMTNITALNARAALMIICMPHMKTPV